MGLTDRHRDRGHATTRSDDPTIAHDARDGDERPDRHEPDRHVDGRDRHVDDRDRGPSTPRRDDVAVVATRRSGAAVAALILGLLGLVLSVVPVLGLIGSLLGIVAIVLGIIGVSRSRKAATKGAGMAVTGIICGVLSLVLGAAGVALFGDAVSNLEQPAEDAVEEIQNEAEELTN